MRKGDAAEMVQIGVGGRGVTTVAVRIKAVIAYDGTDYHGFQRQSPDREPSIQGTLEGALSKIGQPGAVLGAGRTDAGVHASGQVIAFDVELAARSR